LRNWLFNDANQMSGPKIKETLLISLFSLLHERTSHLTRWVVLCMMNSRKH